MHEKEKAVLAIDPGKDKCGLAVVDFSIQVLCKKIVDREELQAYISRLINIYSIREIIIGDGTFSSEVLEDIKEVTHIPVETVDEAYTTVEAEKRYWQEKGGLWRKIFPFITWKPARPLDDYVAVILAERHLQKGQVDTIGR